MQGAIRQKTPKEITTYYSTTKSTAKKDAFYKDIVPRIKQSEYVGYDTQPYVIPMPKLVITGERADLQSVGHPNVPSRNYVNNVLDFKRAPVFPTSASTAVKGGNALTKKLNGVSKLTTSFRPAPQTTPGSGDGYVDTKNTVIAPIDAGKTKEVDNIKGLELPIHGKNYDVERLPDPATGIPMVVITNKKTGDRTIVTKYQEAGSTFVSVTGVNRKGQFQLQRDPTGRLIGSVGDLKQLLGSNAFGKTKVPHGYKLGQTPNDHLIGYVQTQKLEFPEMVEETQDNLVKKNTDFSFIQGRTPSQKYTQEEISQDQMYGIYIVVALALIFFLSSGD